MSHGGNGKRSDSKPDDKSISGAEIAEKNARAQANGKPSTALALPRPIQGLTTDSALPEVTDSELASAARPAMEPPRPTAESQLAAAEEEEDDWPSELQTVLYYERPIMHRQLPQAATVEASEMNMEEVQEEKSGSLLDELQKSADSLSKLFFKDRKPESAKESKAASEPAKESTTPPAAPVAESKTKPVAQKSNEAAELLPSQEGKPKKKDKDGDTSSADMELSPMRATFSTDDYERNITPEHLGDYDILSPMPQQHRVMDGKASGVRVGTAAHVGVIRELERTAKTVYRSKSEGATIRTSPVESTTIVDQHKKKVIVAAAKTVQRPVPQMVQHVGPSVQRATPVVQQVQQPIPVVKIKSSPIKAKTASIPKSIHREQLVVQLRQSPAKVVQRHMKKVIRSASANPVRARMIELPKETPIIFHRATAVSLKEVSTKKPPTRGAVSTTEQAAAIPIERHKVNRRTMREMKLLHDEVSISAMTTGAVSAKVVAVGIQNAVETARVSRHKIQEAEKMPEQISVEKRKTEATTSKTIDRQTPTPIEQKLVSKLKMEEMKSVGQMSKEDVVRQAAAVKNIVVGSEKAVGSVGVSSHKFQEGKKMPEETLIEKRKAQPATLKIVEKRTPSPIEQKKFDLQAAKTTTTAAPELISVVELKTSPKQLTTASALPPTSAIQVISGGAQAPSLEEVSTKVAVDRGTISTSDQRIPLQVEQKIIGEAKTKEVKVVGEVLVEQAISQPGRVEPISGSQSEIESVSVGVGVSSQEISEKRLAEISSTKATIQAATPSKIPIPISVKAITPQKGAIGESLTAAQETAIDHANIVSGATREEISTLQTAGVETVAEKPISVIEINTSPAEAPITGAFAPTLETRIISEGAASIGPEESLIRKAIDGETISTSDQQFPTQVEQKTVGAAKVEGMKSVEQLPKDEAILQSTSAKIMDVGSEVAIETVGISGQWLREAEKKLDEILVEKRTAPAATLKTSEPETPSSVEQKLVSELKTEEMKSVGQVSKEDVVRQAAALKEIVVGSEMAVESVRVSGLEVQEAKKLPEETLVEKRMAQPAALKIVEKRTPSPIEQKKIDRQTPKTTVLEPICVVEVKTSPKEATAASALPPTSEIQYISGGAEAPSLEDVSTKATIDRGTISTSDQRVPLQVEQKIVGEADIKEVKLVGEVLVEQEKSQPERVEPISGSQPEIERVSVGVDSPEISEQHLAEISTTKATIQSLTPSKIPIPVSIKAITPQKSATGERPTAAEETAIDHANVVSDATREEISTRETVGVETVVGKPISVVEAKTSPTEAPITGAFAPTLETRIISEGAAAIGPEESLIKAAIDRETISTSDQQFPIQVEQKIVGAAKVEETKSVQQLPKDEAVLQSTSAKIMDVGSEVTIETVGISGQWLREAEEKLDEILVEKRTAPADTLKTSDPETPSRIEPKKIGQQKAKTTTAAVPEPISIVEVKTSPKQVTTASALPPTSKIQVISGGAETPSLEDEGIITKAAIDRRTISTSSEQVPLRVEQKIVGEVKTKEVKVVGEASVENEKTQPRQLEPISGSQSEIESVSVSVGSQEISEQRLGEISTTATKATIQAATPSKISIPISIKAITPQKSAVGESPIAAEETAIDQADVVSGAPREEISTVETSGVETVVGKPISVVEAKTSPTEAPITDGFAPTLEMQIISEGVASIGPEESLIKKAIDRETISTSDQQVPIQVEQKSVGAAIVEETESVKQLPKHEAVLQSTSAKIMDVGSEVAIETVVAGGQYLRETEKMPDEILVEKRAALAATLKTSEPETPIPIEQKKFDLQTAKTTTVAAPEPIFVAEVKTSPKEATVTGALPATSEIQYISGGAEATSLEDVSTEVAIDRGTISTSDQRVPLQRPLQSPANVVPRHMKKVIRSASANPVGARVIELQKETPIIFHRAAAVSLKEVSTIEQAVAIPIERHKVNQQTMREMKLLHEEVSKFAMAAGAVEAKMVAVGIENAVETARVSSHKIQETEKMPEQISVEKRKTEATTSKTIDRQTPSPIEQKLVSKLKTEEIKSVGQVSKEDVVRQGAALKEIVVGSEMAVESVLVSGHKIQEAKKIPEETLIEKRKAQPATLKIVEKRRPSPIEQKKIGRQTPKTTVLEPICVVEVKTSPKEATTIGALPLASEMEIQVISGVAETPSLEEVLTKAAIDRGTISTFGEQVPLRVEQKIVGEAKIKEVKVVGEVSVEQEKSQPERVEPILGPESEIEFVNVGVGSLEISEQRLAEISTTKATIEAATPSKILIPISIKAITPQKSAIVESPTAAAEKAIDQANIVSGTTREEISTLETAGVETVAEKPISVIEIDTSPAEVPITDASAPTLETRIISEGAAASIGPEESLIKAAISGRVEPILGSESEIEFVNVGVGSQEISEQRLAEISTTKATIQAATPSKIPRSIVVKAITSRRGAIKESATAAEETAIERAAVVGEAIREEISIPQVAVIDLRPITQDAVIEEPISVNEASTVSVSEKVDEESVEESLEACPITLDLNVVLNIELVDSGGESTSTDFRSIEESAEKSSSEYLATKEDVSSEYLSKEEKAEKAVSNIEEESDRTPTTLDVTTTVDVCETGDASERGGISIAEKSTVLIDSAIPVDAEVRSEVTVDFSESAEAVAAAETSSVEKAESASAAVDRWTPRTFGGSNVSEFIRRMMHPYPTVPIEVVDVSASRPKIEWVFIDGDGRVVEGSRRDV